MVATGYNHTPRLPDWPGRDAFTGELVHSSAYRNPAPYRGRQVLVVGAGNSGAEIAADPVEGGAAKVWISIHTPPNIVRRDARGRPSRHAPMAAAPGLYFIGYSNPISGNLREISRDAHRLGRRLRSG